MLEAKLGRVEAGLQARQTDRLYGRLWLIVAGRTLRNLKDGRKESENKYSYTVELRIISSSTNGLFSGAWG
jgi:hypothetical protein